MQKHDAKITFNIENTIIYDQGSARYEEKDLFNSLKSKVFTAL